MLGVAGLLRSSCLSLSSLKQGTVQRLCAHAGEMTPGISVRMQEKWNWKGGKAIIKVHCWGLCCEQQRCRLQGLLRNIQHASQNGPLKRGGSSICPLISIPQGWILPPSFHQYPWCYKTQLLWKKPLPAWNCLPTCLESRVWARRDKMGNLRGTFILDVLLWGQSTWWGNWLRWHNNELSTLLLSLLIFENHVTILSQVVQFFR